MKYEIIHVTYRQVKTVVIADVTISDTPFPVCHLVPKNI